MTQLRAVIYARYSSDLQREESIEDQVRECQRLATQMGWNVAEVLSDAAVSGSIQSRPGLQAVLNLVKKRQVDIVLTEALDRMSRDQEHIAHIFKQLTFCQVKLHTIAEGAVNELHIGLKGTMNALFLKDMAEKIRRGQKGRVLAQRSPGGLAYGYDVIRRFGVDGMPDNGLRSINAAEATVVRQIFDLYADGLSARQIAKLLNTKGIRAPRGGLWNASSISGNRARRDGILWNEMYLGRLLYNRQRFMKDPETAKRVPRVNPQEQWVIVEQPELRIIPDELWSHVHARIEAKQFLPLHKQRGPRRLLSGLLHCGVCGGPFTIIGEGRLGCSAHKERGSCTNGKKLSATRVEDAVLNGVKTYMLQAKLIEEFTKTFNQELMKASHAANVDTNANDKKRIELDKQLDRLLNAMQQGGPLPSLMQRLRDVEQQKAALMQQTTAAPKPRRIELPIPALAEIYQQKVDNLRSSLTADQPTQIKAATLLSNLLSRVELHPLGGKGAAMLKITGDMAATIDLGPKYERTAVKVVARA